jgi:hypothetical protein
MNMAQVEDCILEAIEAIENYVEKTTGEKPTREEVAKALQRYFVLKEIADHIKIEE